MKLFNIKCRKQLLKLERGHGANIFTDIAPPFHRAALSVSEIFASSFTTRKEASPKSTTPPYRAAKRIGGAQGKYKKCGSTK